MSVRDDDEGNADFECPSDATVPTAAMEVAVVVVVVAVVAVGSATEFS